MSAVDEAREALCSRPTPNFEKRVDRLIAAVRAETWRCILPAEMVPHSHLCSAAEDIAAVRAEYSDLVDRAERLAATADYRCSVCGSDDRNEHNDEMHAQEGRW